MKPLNQKERRIAFIKFLFVFLLSLVVIIFSGYVAGIKIPPSTGKYVNKDCTARATLVAYIDSLNLSISNLHHLDTLLLKATIPSQGTIQSDIQKAVNKLNGVLDTIKSLPVEAREKNALYNIGRAWLALRYVPAVKCDSCCPPSAECKLWENRVREANSRIVELKKIAGEAGNKTEDLDIDIKFINMKGKKTKAQVMAEVKKITGMLKKSDYISPVQDY